MFGFVETMAGGASNWGGSAGVIKKRFVGASRHTLFCRPLSSAAHSNTINPFVTAIPMSGTFVFL
jgi:hypothetical protein